MRLAAQPARPKGRDAWVIDDSGREHKLYKHGHPPDADVPESWWRPVVEGILARERAEAAEKVAKRADRRRRYGAIMRKVKRLRDDPAVARAWNALVDAVEGVE